MTLRPSLVFMRARNPCVRARFRFLGCHVRFVIVEHPRLVSGDRRIIRPVSDKKSREDGWVFPYATNDYTLRLDARQNRLHRDIHAVTPAAT